MKNTPDHPRHGFTRVELSVVIVIVSLLAAILLPALSRSREVARATQCRGFLKELGEGLRLFAESDPTGRLCSGAYDPVRDGCPKPYGWTANLDGVGVADVNGMRCPANPLRGLEKLNELLVETGPWDARYDATRIRAGECETIYATPDSTERAPLVAKLVLEGDNTNYASSWHMVRGQPDVVEGRVVVAKPGAWADLRDLGPSTGPLTLAELETSIVPSNNVPLLADAAGGEATLAETLPTSNGSPLDGLSVGARLAKSYNDGPAFTFDRGISPLRPTILRDAGLPGVPENGDSVPATMLWVTRFPKFGEQVTVESQTEYTEATVLVLQDTRAWLAVHDDQANVLVADGGVKQLTDVNGDRFFNPGFPMPREVGLGDRAATTGYVDGLVEIHPANVFTGTFLSDVDVAGAALE